MLDSVSLESLTSSLLELCLTSIALNPDVLSSNDLYDLRYYLINLICLFKRVGFSAPFDVVIDTLCSTLPSEVFVHE